MQVRATAKLRYVSIPPRKMRLVAGMVKGMPVQEALDLLNFTPKIAARHLAKTVKSAAANALSQEGTDHLRPESLTIANIIVDEAPTMKRIRFQSMGRVFRYRKRFSHLTVYLEGSTDIEEEVETKPTRRGKAKEEGEETGLKKKKTTRKKAARKKAAAGDAEETAEASGKKTAEKKPKKKAASKSKKAKPKTGAAVKKTSESGKKADTDTEDEK